MPYCDVVYIWMALSYFRGKRLQTIWEPFRIGLEVSPRPLKLCLSGGQRLPVVIDDEVGDVNVFFGQSV